jgi:hypothetical protein
MRFSIFTFFLILSSFNAQGQIVFFSDNFDLPAGGSQSNNAGQNWTLNDGSNGVNTWHIAQTNNTPCGTGNSLFIADQNSTISNGIYNTSLNSSCRAVSPIISTVGCSDIILRFDWVGIGEASFTLYDYGTLLLSNDGGLTWQAYNNTFANESSCQVFEITLGPEYENQTDFRIAFNWTNDGSAGSSPGFNIDNIRLLKNAPIAILPSFSPVLCIGGSFQVPFVIDLPFNAGNIYTVDLSDANGSFINPTTVGSIAGTLDGVVNIIIPENINPVGTYYLRINGSNPLYFSEPFGPISWTVDYFDLLTNTGTSNLCNGPVTITLDETILDLVWSTGVLNIPLLTVTSPATIFATGRNSSGCLALSDTLNIISTTPLQVSTIPASPVSYCGIPITVEVGPGFDSYQWSNGDTTSSIIIDTIITEAIGLIALDENGCYADPFSLEIEFSTDVSIAVTPDNPVLCGNEIEVTVTADPSFTEYQWFEIQPELMVPIGTSNETSIFSEGQYIVFARDISGCYAVSDTLDVTEGQFPIPNFTYSQNQGSYTITFTNTSQNGVTYFWTIDTLGTSDLEDIIFTFPENGPYEVTLQVINGCDTVEITKLVFVTLVGIEDLNANSEIRIGPNPANSQLFLYTQTETELSGIFQVTDPLGRILLSVESEISSEQPLIINLESLQTGMYLIHGQTNKGVISTRFIKK